LRAELHNGPSRDAGECLPPLQASRFLSVLATNGVLSLRPWGDEAWIEYTRKRRTLLGNFELLGLSHWILTAENRIRFQFLSHKVFRLLAPLAFLIMLFSSWLQRGFVFHVLFLAQVTFYLLGMFDRWIPSRTWLRSVSSLASFFLVVHRGALVGFIRWSSALGVAVS
jgi:hypothetical protein